MGRVVLELLIASCITLYYINKKTKMKAFVIAATLACAVPAALSTFTTGTATISLPTISLGTATTGTSGLAITGLSAASATLAGVGGLIGAVAAGAALGSLARAATRNKRSVVTDQEIGEQFVFDSIAAIDNLDCGKRYLCEVAATPVDQLTQEELTSLLLFQTAPGAPNSGKALFDEAVRLGALSRSHQTCQLRYKTCPEVSELSFASPNRV